MAALRSFADYLAGCPDLDEPWTPVTAATRSIDEHGDGTAFRALHAEAIEELGRRAGIAHAVAD